MLAALVHALLAREPAARPADAAGVAERLGDIAARVRTERTSGDPPPSAVPVTVAAVAAGVAQPPPDVPLPNPSMLPAELWGSADALPETAAPP
jgi:hypothetical protein